MKAVAKILQLTSEECKAKLIRNLSRILDMRIVDIDINSNTITFLYASQGAFTRIKNEFSNLGYEIMDWKVESPSISN